jgi:hypothetical protein
MKHSQTAVLFAVAVLFFALGDVCLTSDQRGGTAYR